MHKMRYDNRGLHWGVKEGKSLHVIPYRMITVKALYGT
jgi:hypothetical protein